jgi:hypothetical protein
VAINKLTILVDVDRLQKKAAGRLFGGRLTLVLAAR